MSKEKRIKCSEVIEALDDGINRRWGAEAERSGRALPACALCNVASAQDNAMGRHSGCAPCPIYVYSGKPCTDHGQPYSVYENARTLPLRRKAIVKMREQLIAIRKHFFGK